LPAEVFTTEWKNPTAETGMAHRNNLREAIKLLNEAGWTTKDGVLTNEQGEKFEVEFLLVQPAFQNWVLPYKQDLEKIGVKANVRLVDSSQYQRRIEQFDFDIIVDSFGQSHSPGNEQRNYWGSEAAERSGSDNTPGIKSKAIDALIDKVVFAKDRETLVAATNALDRVLLWGNYVVPQWHYPYDRWAYWDMFGRPEQLPSQAASILRVWWVDADKDKALASARGN
jgi:microcin C transport system substrate-binding protein